MSLVAAIALAMARPWKPSCRPARVRMPDGADGVAEPLRAGARRERRGIEQVGVQQSNRSGLLHAAHRVHEQAALHFVEHQADLAEGTAADGELGPQFVARGDARQLLQRPTGSSKVTLRSIASSSRVMAIARDRRPPVPATGPTTVTLSDASRSPRAGRAPDRRRAARAAPRSAFAGHLEARAQPGRVAAPDESVITGRASPHCTSVPAAAPRSGVGHPDAQALAC